MTERSDPSTELRTGLVRKAYEDEELARSYEAERSKNRFQRFRASLERSMLERALEGAPRGSVLDVACGTGRLSEVFARAGTYTGLDASAAMLDQARRAHAGAWVRGDALRIPFAAKSFDLVVSTRFLRHLDSRGRLAVFKELARISRGAVLVELLLGAGLVWRWKQLTHSTAWNADASPRRPTHEQIVRELSEAGLCVKARHALVAGVSQPHVYLCEPAR